MGSGSLDHNGEFNAPAPAAAVLGAVTEAFAGEATFATSSFALRRRSPIAGCQVMARGEDSVAITRSYRTPETIVTSVLITIFMLPILVFTLDPTFLFVWGRRQQVLTVTVVDVEGGARISLGGTTSPEAVGRLNEVLRALPALTGSATSRDSRPHEDDNPPEAAAMMRGG